MSRALICDQVEEELVEDGINYLSVVNKGKLAVAVVEDGNNHFITIQDVVEYYSTQANNIVSGCRQLGDIIGDWRPIDSLAKTCLEVFKRLDIQKLRKVGKQTGLTPKF